MEYRKNDIITLKIRLRIDLEVKVSERLMACTVFVSKMQ